MYSQALSFLDADPNLPNSPDSIIQALALKSAAHARLHRFDDAEQDLRRAEELCNEAPQPSCGAVVRARGVLELQRGRPDLAKGYFEQTLGFARDHDDQFLAATALLNLGLGALQEQHYDEAIDRTDAAYQIAIALDAGTVATKALGNLGWAYYNLGDSEKSLQLSLEAEKRAIQVGDVIDELSWVTTAGYVYQQMHDLSRAKQSYLAALELARKTQGREDIYNALRALALVSDEAGELEQARKYSDEAMAIAQQDHNRLDELYPLLVKGLIVAHAHEPEQAERIFQEVERDASANATLKWQAEHALARIFEVQKDAQLANSSYLKALGIFESARSSLKRSDAKLPFSTNAERIYDDYIHFLVAQGKAEEALRWADYSRARTLSDGLALLSSKRVGGNSTSNRLEPPPLDARSLARRSKALIFFYWLGESQSYLWAVSAQEIKLFTLPPRAQIEQSVQRYRKSLTGPQDVLESSDQDGLWLYRTLVAPSEEMRRNGLKLAVIPDGALNALNFETLIVAKPKPHFFIEDAEISNSSSLRVLGASFTGSNPHKQKRTRSMLLLGDSIAPSREYPELPRAANQVTTVAKHFAAADRRIFTREQATPHAYLSSAPEQFSYIHFVAHGTASLLSPLDSAIVLSRNANDPESFKLYAREIIRHPLHADLVTISACYGAGERFYSGEGLVGLAWAFLRAGAHNVIASLWEVTDASTDQLMDKFYDELAKGASAEAALRAAKLSLLQGNFRSPFYWGPFQLYIGS